MSRDSSLAGDQINQILRLSSSTEYMTAIVHLHRNQLDRAASYFQRGLCFARMYEGEEAEKSNLPCKTLRVYGNLQSMQGNLAAVVASAEEAYNYVAVTYNPVHPEVQRAAGTLIERLCREGDLYNVERFAEATLDSLKDPANKVDQQSKGVARGYYNLADVINRQKKDLVKAEMLARESLRIRTRIFHNDDSFVGMSTDWPSR
jgi:tetratricopeptide (TPR) repeat protein